MADRYWVGGSGTWNTTTTNWSATSGGASGASAPTAADNVFFNGLSNIGTSGFTVTIGTANVSCLNFTVSGLDGAMTLSFAATSRYILVFGNWSNPATSFGIITSLSAVAGISFQPAAGTTRTVTTNGISIPSPLVIEFAGSTTGTLQLVGALTQTGTFFWTAGTLDLNGFTFTTGVFQSSGTSTKAIAFGSANIVLNSNSAGETVLSMPTATGFTWTGTGGFVRNQRNTASFIFGTTGGTVTNAPNLTFNSVTSTSTITGNSWFKDLTFTTSTCIVNNSVLANGINIAGVLSLATGGASTIYQGFHPNLRSWFVNPTLNTFSKPLGSLTITSGTVTLASTVDIIASGTIVFTTGNIVLNGFNLSTGIFSSSNTSSRAVAFGSNNITLTSTTASTTILNMANATNFAWTGTGGFVRDQAATATVVFGTTGGTVSNAPNLTVNAGASALTITTNSWFKNTDFTGSTCTVTGAGLTLCVLNVSGDLTLAVGGTYISVQPVFRSSSTLTSVGRSVEDPTINGVGITVTLNGAFTLASGIDFFLANGTLNLNAYSLTCRSFGLSAGTKNITFNGGTIFILDSFSGSSNPTGFTTTAGTGTGTISFTSASSKSLSTVGITFNCTINQGGAGSLTISNDLGTINNLTNTVQPASILFGVGTTTYFNNFSVAGTAGNLITIATFGTTATHTLSKASGTVSVSFCSISYSNATGGASWQSFITNGNVDAGNNTGWSFTGGPIVVLINELIYVSDQCDAIYTTSSIVNEQILLQDTLSSIYITDSSLSESFSLTDSLSTTYDGFVVCTDSISLSAPLSVIAAFIVVCTDSISLTDSLSANYSTSVSLTDTIHISESLLSNVDIPVSINDVVGFSSDLSVSGIFYVVSQNSVNLVDSAAPIATMNVSSADTINMLAVNSGRFPWDLIDDDTDSNWQVISTVPYIT